MRAALCALAAIGASAAVEARAAAPGSACPPAGASVFAENGAEGNYWPPAPASQPLCNSWRSDRPRRSASALPRRPTPIPRNWPWICLRNGASPTEVRNAGVGGEVSSATLARLRSELASRRPDLVIWQVGTNDAVAGVDAAVFRANLEAGVAAARAQRVPIILVDPQFYFGIKDLARFKQFVAIVSDVGARMHVPVFSRFAMMKAWAAQIGRRLERGAFARRLSHGRPGLRLFRPRSGRRHRAGRRARRQAGRREDVTPPARRRRGARPFRTIQCRFWAASGSFARTAARSNPSPCLAARPISTTRNRRPRAAG